MCQGEVCTDTDVNTDDDTDANDDDDAWWNIHDKALWLINQMSQKTQELPGS